MATIADAVGTQKPGEGSSYTLPAHVALMSWRTGPALLAFIVGVAIWEAASRMFGLRRATHVAVVFAFIRSSSSPS